MSKVRFDWLANGEEVVIGDMPLEGHYLIRAIKERSTKTLSNVTRAKFLFRCTAMNAVKTILDRHGPEKAKELWESTLNQIIIEEQLRPQLKWPVDQFAKNFEAIYKDEVLARLDAKTLEEAIQKTVKETKDLDPNDFVIDQEALFHEMFLIELYWRLYPDFDTVRIKEDSKRVDVPLTMDNLRKVVRYPSDAEKFYIATRKPAKNPSLMDELAVKSEDDVRKNLQMSSTTSMPSKQDSHSTSTATTETVVT